MRLRSLLFVPGDRPERMRRAWTSGADALIIDLEDSVAPAAKPAARLHAGQFLREMAALRSAGDPLLFVRINALDQPMLDLDLDAVLPWQPYGIMLPKAEGAAALALLDARLAGSDAVILPIVTETPKAMFLTGSYGGVTPRLCALSWGAEDLSTALGASTARERDGSYRAPYQLARSLTLFGAHAAGVAALETIFPDFADSAACSAYAARARQDGFSGMMAIHPAQVPLIHAAFLPTADEIAAARRVLDAAALHAGQGAFSIDGRMIDAPHIAEARRLLAQVPPQVPL